MKKTLTILAVLSVASAAFAQGTVTANNRVTGKIVAPIYVNNVGAARIHGNAPDGTPAGQANYGQLKKADGTIGSPDSKPWKVEFWGVLAGDEWSKAKLAGTSTMRAGAAAGFFNQVTAVVPDVATGANADMMIKVYDGADWDSSLWRGYSEKFLVEKLGGGLVTPPNMTNLKSFTIDVVPEPSSLALLGLGAAALVIFRRRN